MNQQTQFSFSHIISPAVEVANYSTFQHQLHSYGNISTVGNLTGLGSNTVPVVPPAHSVALQDVATPAGHLAGASGVVAMGYTQHPQPGPVQSYHAVFNNVAVAHVTPQVAPPQIQYFSYESPGVNVRTQLHGHHPHQTLPQQSQQNQIKYSNCSFSLQTVSNALPLSCNASASSERSGEALTTAEEATVTQRRESNKRRKSRKEGTNAKLKRKINRNRGEAYINTAGKLIDAKKYVDQDCKCKSKCLSKLGTVTDRESIFKQFWAIGDFEQQNVYLTENVVLLRNTRKRRKTPLLTNKNLKTVTRLYNVTVPNSAKQIRICKTMFLNLHGVSNGRLDRVLQAVSCEFPETLQDRRGRHTPSNKTSKEDIDFVIQHICTKRMRDEASAASISSTQSEDGPPAHASEISDGKDIPVKRLYEMYKRICEKEGRVPVSLWVYRQLEKSKMLHDHRGHQTLGNLASKEDVDFVVQYIFRKRMRDKPPVGTISSVQSQDGPCSRTSLESDGKEASVRLMYDSYKRACEEEERAPVSLWVYRQLEKSKVLQENVVKDTDFANFKLPAVSVANDSTPLADNTNLYTVTVPEAQDQPVNTIINTGNTAETLAINEKKKTPKGHGGIMSRKERKRKRNSGAAYITASGKFKNGKVYVDKDCGCKYKCIPELGTVESRKKIFDNFWRLADFTRQNAYIAQKVSLVPVSQKHEEKVIEKLTRTYSRIYNVQLKPGAETVRVCKSAFLQLHGVSNGRVNRVLQAVACRFPFALKDRRGQHSPKNKTQEEDVNYACCHIRSFPGEYHSKPDGTSVLYLPHDLNVQKMYEMYKTQCIQAGRSPIGSFVYRKILKERFKCCIKSPANKTPDEELECVWQHIQTCVPQFSAATEEATGAGPTQANQHCRIGQHQTNIKMLHRDYAEKCLREGKKPIGIDVYRKVYNSKFPSQATVKQVLSVQVLDLSPYLAFGYFRLRRGRLGWLWEQRQLLTGDQESHSSTCQEW